MGYYVYILVSETDGSLYTGQTDDLVDRLKRHNHGWIRATRRKSPYRLGYFEEHPSRADAMWREWQLKTKHNTERKRKLIQEFPEDRVRTILGL